MSMSRTDLPDGSAVLTMPYDEGLLQKSVTQSLDDQTETPSPSGEGDGDGDAGPIMRFNDIFTDVGSTHLEALGMDGFEIGKAIQKRRDELFRNQFPIIDSRFVHKCEDCGAEYDEEHVFCPACQSDELREPNPEDKRRARRMFESVNKEGQSLRELWQALEDDHGRLGVAALVIRYDYVVATGDETVLGRPVMDRGDVIRKEVNEMVRADPKRVVPVTDEDGRVGGWKWACPLHRGDALADNPGTCDECGCELREVYFVEKSQVHSTDDGVEKYYFEDEVLTYAHFYPRQHGLDGLSPVHHVWLKQAILHWMDVYAGAYYDPNSDRYPNKFMVVHTTNADAWERNFDRAEDEASENLYANQIFVNEYAADSSSTPDLQVVDFMDDTLRGQNEAVQKQYKSDIRTQFGVTDVFDSELDDAGGLNNEGLQLEVTDRSVASSQHDLTTGPLDELMKRLGFDDWRLTFVPPRERDLDELEQKVGIGERASKAGLEASWEDDDISIPDGDFEAQEPEGGMGGLFGGPDDGPGDETPGGEMPGEGSLFEQADVDEGTWEAGLRRFRVYPEEDDDTGYDGDLLGVGVEMPEAGVYIDWRLEAFPDPLDEPHVSEYGSVDDFQRASGHEVEYMTDGGEAAGGEPLEQLKAKSGGEGSEYRKAADRLGEAFDHIVWASDDALETKAEPYWAEDEDVPLEVKEAVRWAVRNAGAIFEDIDGLEASEKLKEFFEEKLTQKQGWSLRSIAEDLEEAFGLPEEKAEAVARSESASVLSSAREKSFTSLEEEAGEGPLRYKWIGPGRPDDGRTTEACVEMKQRTDPRFGGQPRTMDELLRLEREVQEKHFPELDFRRHVVHPNERHTFTEAVGY